MATASLSRRPAFGAANAYDLSGPFLSSHATIQAAVDTAPSGGFVVVGDGAFVENVVIDKTLTLTSDSGRGDTSIIGESFVGALGTITVTDGAADVVIGEAGAGLTMVGIDNGNGAVENAAIYLQGSQDGLVVEDNEIVANGEHGLLSEFGGALTNATITGNEFSGQTFQGANPDGVGFSTQFNAVNNVPRQLVVVGEGGSGSYNSANITFTNKLLSGRTGGISTDDGVSE
jgi:hypothetical protein